MDAAFKWLMLFMGTQVAVIGVGLLPLHLWRSFRTETDQAPTGPAGKAPAPSAAGA
jgi:hypothetical protein